MRKLIFLILLFVFGQSYAIDKYVSPNGSNTNAGNILTPWKLPSYACAHTTSGDVIHVLSGTYNETAQLVLPVGVSMEGDLATIVSTFNGAALSLSSGVDGSNGNQHVSGIKFDGSNLTGKKGIIILARSNVKIFNCTIQNFLEDGILFKGAVAGGKPIVYATGNELYGCIITNNSDRNTGQANIVATGYRGMLIHDNIITQTARPLGHNGNSFSATIEGFSEGLKFYNNKSFRNPNEGVEWSFHLELWDSQGNMEVYSNEFYGGDMAIDFGGNNLTKGVYTYGAFVHDNLFQFNTSATSTPGKQQLAINIEGNSEYITIENNHFKNYPDAIQITLGHASIGTRNITIQKNLFENGGYISDSWCFDIQMLTEAQGSYIDGVFIYNNTFITTSSSILMTYTFSNDFVRNIYFINNIVKGVRNYAYITFMGVAGTKDNWNIKNNLLYQNSNSNTYQVQSGATLPTNWNYTSPIIGNPLLDGLFHLQVGSPAIDAGFNIGLPYYGLHPDIGFNESLPNPLATSIITKADVITNKKTHITTIRYIINGVYKIFNYKYK